MHTMINRIVVILSIFFSCFAWSEESTQQPSVVTHGDWGVQCADQADVRICQAIQVLWLEQDGQKQRVLTLQLIPGAENQKILQLSFPLGVDLRPGIVIAVDGGSEQKFPYATCSNQNCLSLILMTTEKLADFQKGNVLKVGFRPFGSEKTVVLEASLKGFTKANDEVKRGA
ncbi:MAG: invasion associated locus B family protein [Oceanospirillales bacterium]|nr:invasion associated locus B family protein [Oceanospirillales bacterium]MBR9887059.1 invasion associated locus B family protein [Oceanospirillales bacterium]